MNNRLKWLAVYVVIACGIGYVIHTTPLEAAETEKKAYVKVIKTGEVAVYDRKRLPLSERRALPDGVHADNYPWF